MLRKQLHLQALHAFRDRYPLICSHVLQDTSVHSWIHVTCRLDNATHRASNFPLSSLLVTQTFPACLCVVLPAQRADALNLTNCVTRGRPRHNCSSKNFHLVHSLTGDSQGCEKLCKTVHITAVHSWHKVAPPSPPSPQVPFSHVLAGRTGSMRLHPRPQDENAVGCKRSASAAVESSITVSTNSFMLYQYRKMLNVVKHLMRLQVEPFSVGTPGPFCSGARTCPSHAEVSCTCLSPSLPLSLSPSLFLQA